MTQFLNKLRILIVDDEVALLESYKNILSPSQKKAVIKSSRSSFNNETSSHETDVNTYEVVTVESFDKALFEIKKSIESQNPFALAFCDVRLGEERDGVELARQMRALDTRLGIIFVTAYNDRSLGSIEKVLGEEVSHLWDYLNKPFHENEILQKARNFVTLWNLSKEHEEQAQSLAELNRQVLENERINSVAAVARGVTHEFGNLLMQIIGQAEINREKTTEEMKYALDRIIEASQRASEILDRFNNLSDNKSAGTVKTVCNIESVLAEAIDLISHQLKKENVKIDLQTKVLAGLVLEAHSTSLLQVFINLMINSIHALEGRTQKRITIEAEKKSEQIELRFKDNGPGAPPELIDRLTEAFFTTKGAKGTGLGLAGSGVSLQDETFTCITRNAHRKG